MNSSTLERAIEIQRNIKVLEEEVKHLKEHPRQRRFWPIRNKLSKKTCNGFWVSENLDSIGSVIMLSPDDIQVVISCKEEKINKLNQELSGL